MFLLKIRRLPVVASCLLAFTIVSFNSTKPFEFDGGTITNPNIILTGTGVPVILNATRATGCNGTITYQWQQSVDITNFVDIPGATDTSYQSGSIMADTYFRRKSICAGEDTVYTNNFATVIVQP